MNLPGYRLLIPMLLLVTGFVDAQQTRDNPASATETVQQQVDRLADMVNREQAALESSQRQIELLRRQVAELQGQLVGTRQPPQQTTEEAVARLNADVENIRERQEVQQSEIATHEQDKVESASKFPVKVTGLILMNTFVNTAAVDVPPSPTWPPVAGGTTGISLRQTVLGLDARGPHIFGANSDADVRMDFFGGVNPSGGYSQNSGLARLRTAHAELAWDRTRAFFALDRPIVSPNIPSSLTAIAQPELSWSGNLWNWMPQVGAEHTLKLNESSRLSLQGAIADVPDPPVPTAEHHPALQLPAWGSRAAGRGAKPGLGMPGAMISLACAWEWEDTSVLTNTMNILVSTPGRRPSTIASHSSRTWSQAGVSIAGWHSEDWAAALLKTICIMEQNENYFYRPLDDVGGWTQLKARANERLEFNVGYGLDNAFANEIRPFVLTASSTYQSLARNATWFSNVIYSPTAYTLFSFEYRRIDSSYAIGPHSVADVYGVAGGYRF